MKKLRRHNVPAPTAQQAVNVAHNDAGLYSYLNQPNTTKAAYAAKKEMQHE